MTKFLFCSTVATYQVHNAQGDKRSKMKSNETYYNVHSYKQHAHSYHQYQHEYDESNFIFEVTVAHL